MCKDKELSNPYLEPNTSGIANVASSSLYSKTCSASPLPPSFPPTAPPGRPGTLGTVEAANQHSFTAMTRIPYQNKCLQPYRNKLKVALMIAVLTVVMVTVPAVYRSVIIQKTEIPNINTSILTQMTEVLTENSHLTFNGM